MIIYGIIGLNETVELGGTLHSCTQTSSPCLYLAKYDSMGQLQWSRVNPGMPVFIGPLVVDSAGDIIITGACAGLVNVFGTGAVQCYDPFNPMDILVAKISAQGTGLWAHHYGGAGVAALAVDPVTDEIVFASYGADPVNFGNGPIARAAFSKIDPMGGHLWTLTGDVSRVGVGRLAVSTSGEIAFVGANFAPTQLGGMAIPGPLPGQSDRRIVGMVAEDGTPRWIQSDGETRPYDVTFDADENVGVLAALPSTGGPYDVGCGATFPETTEGNNFLVKLDRAGACRWQHRLAASVVGAFPSNDFFAVVHVPTPTTDLGTGPLGGVGAAAVRLDGANGTVLWAYLLKGELGGPLSISPGRATTWLGRLEGSPQRYFLQLPP